MKSLAAADSQILKNELGAGEKLVWSGHPDAGRASRSSMGIFLFAIPWTAFAVFWVGAAYWGTSRGGHVSGVGLFFPLFGLPFIFIGLTMLSSPLFAYNKAKNTHYGVTNKRILIVVSGKTKTIQQYEYDTLTNLTRTEYGTRGDLVWSLTNTLPGLRASSQYGNQYSNGGSSAVNNTVAFWGIEKPKDVERMIEEQIKKLASGDANVQQ